MWGTIQLGKESVLSFKTETTQCVSNPLETSANNLLAPVNWSKSLNQVCARNGLCPPAHPLACTQPCPHGKNLASRKPGLLLQLGKCHFFFLGILPWRAWTRHFSGPFQTSLLCTNDSSCLNFHLLKFWKDLGYHLIGHYPSPFLPLNSVSLIPSPNPTPFHSVPSQLEHCQVNKFKDRLQMPLGI